MMTCVDLNSDLGESFGSYTIGQDKDVISYISSANIACGWHAGDPLVMARTVRYAKEAGIAIGAHPGFHDLEGFGRRKMVITPEEAKCYIQYQLGALTAFAQAQGMKIQHVKPHGALYNMAAVDPALALAIAEGIKEVDPSVILLGLAGSEMLKAAQKIGLPCASEVFADRAYMDDGTLSPRSMPGSVIHDKKLAIARTVTMVKEGYVESINGKKITIQADSICVHGDNADAIAFTAGIREALTREGIVIAPLTQVLAQKG